MVTPKNTKKDEDDVIYLDQVETTKYVNPNTSSSTTRPNEGMDSVIKVVLALTAAIVLAFVLLFCCCFGSSFFPLLLSPSSI